MANENDVLQEKPPENEPADYDGPWECGLCEYSELSRPDTQLKRHRLCRRFPPAPVALPIAQNGALVGFSVTAMSPVVEDAYWCHEFEPRDGEEIEPPPGLLLVGSKAANG